MQASNETPLASSTPAERRPQDIPGRASALISFDLWTRFWIFLPGGRSPWSGAPPIRRSPWWGTPWIFSTAAEAAEEALMTSHAYSGTRVDEIADGIDR